MKLRNVALYLEGHTTHGTIHKSETSAFENDCTLSLPLMRFIPSNFIADKMRIKPHSKAYIPCMKGPV
jgi:hypothetical protein